MTNFFDEPQTGGETEFGQYYDEPVFANTQTATVVQKKQSKGRRIITILLALMLTAVMLALSMLLFVYKRYDVNGFSMTPTIEDGSYVWINKLKTAKRYDVVAIEAAPYNEKTNAQMKENGSAPIADDKLPSKLLKRIVGIAGDTLSVDGDRYLVVETNGVKKYLGAEDYGNGKLSKLAYWLYGRENFSETITIPAGCVFVLGDFRGKAFDNSVSVDSRMFGVVAVKDIIGVVVYY